MKQESEKDKKLDNLFKSGLGDSPHEPAFREEDWAAMEAMLDKKGKKRGAIVYWLPALATMAAAVLLFLGFWLFNPQVVKNRQGTNNNMAANLKPQQPASTAPANSIQGKKDTVNSDGAGRQANATATFVKPSANKTAINAGKLLAVTGSKKRNKYLPVPADGGRRDVTSNKNADDIGGNGANKQTLAATNASVSPKNNADDKGITKPVVADAPASPPNSSASSTANANTLAVNTTQPADNTAAAKTADAGNDAKPVTHGRSKHAPSATGYKPQFAISALASSDFNGVGSAFQQTRLGGNFGLMFSAGISKKITLSTGAIYAIKPYAETNAQYHTAYQFNSPPQQVLADCRMIDVPINIDYQVYRQSRNKFSVGTGLSSYLMLNESYKFTYSSDNSSWGSSYLPSNYKVPHPGKYYFGVLNLDATYQRQVSSKFGVTLKPYMKIPLSNVGYSQVKLQSTGLAIGVSYNLGSATK